jgi:hypothetical protein
MDMYAAAELARAVLETEIDDLSDRIMGMRLRRGRLQAGQAIALLRKLAPDAMTVRFWGPREPGDTVTIREIIDKDLRAIYLVDAVGDPEEGEDLFDELTPIQDWLTGALENEVTFTMFDGEYVLRLRR